MDSINFAQFDIRGTRPENRILNEKIPIKDKTCPWVIPNGSPFFGEALLTKLYDARGAELTLGRDYWFEGEFGPFCELSGRSICSFIKLSQAVRNTGAFVTATYQSIGAWFFPRNNLDDWVKEMTQGNVPIPWSKVFGVPPELPASFHSHSAVTEVGDWFELGFFFNYMAGIYKTRNPNTPNLANQVITDGFAQLKAVKTQQLQRLVSHDGDYNKPHNPTKEQLGLGKLDNFATAKLSDQLAGVSNTLFSTVLGVKELSKFYKRPTPDLMRPGIIPISRYGSWKYIPPLIKGSFEGMGSESGAAAICLEPDGTLSILNNHYDGRTRGLYFSKVEGYNALGPKHTFTYHRYDPPALASTGLVLNRVVPGSGPKVILAGLHRTANWFIALTNGTLDPRGHAFVKCDMTAVANFLNDAVKPAYSSSDDGVIHHMGDYLVLVHTYTGVGVNTPARHAFFRVKTADVLAGKNVMWEQFNVTYSTYDGVAASVKSFMEVVVPVSAGGKLTRLGPFTVTPEMTNFAPQGKTLSLSSPKTGIQGVYNFSLLTSYRLSYVKDGENRNLRCVLETTYDFDPATGVFTSKAKTPAFSYDFLNPLTDEQYLRYQYLASAMKNGNPPSTVLLETGEFVTATRPATRPPHPVQVVTQKLVGRDSPEAVLGTLLNADIVAEQYRFAATEIRESPLKSGMYAAGVVYDTTGEVFEAINQSTLLREIYYRSVTGGYQVRPGLKNIGVGDVIARPLSDTVYSTNLVRQDPMISFTGSTTELASAGVECGSSSLSVCGYSSVEGYANALPNNPALRAPANPGVLISFPRTFTKTIDEVQKKATYAGTTFYGLNQAVIDQLFGKVQSPSVGDPEWSFTLHVLGSEAGGMFAQLNLAVVQLCWKDPNTGHPRIKLILARPTVEVPNDTHPDVYLITALQILNESIAVKANPLPLAKGSGMSQFYSYKDVRFSVERPLMTGYRDGSVIKLFVLGGHFVSVGAVVPLCNVFDINLTTNQIENIATGTEELGWGDYVAAIPKVGISDYTKKTVTYPSPPAVPATWKCRNRGVTTSTTIVQRNSAGYLYSPTLRTNSLIEIYSGGGDTESGNARCSACFLNVGNDARDQIVAFEQEHYIYTPAYTPPPPEPDDVYLVPQTGGFFFNTGGAGGIAKKTVNGVTSSYLMASVYPNARWVLQFAEDAEFMINGTLYTLPAGTIDLRDVIADPKNKTFYLYATVEGILPKYVLSTAKLRKRSALLPIGVLTTNDNQILTIKRTQPFMVGEYLFSHERDGGIVPISSGFPQDEGVFKFIKNSELLP